MKKRLVSLIASCIAVVSFVTFMPANAIFGTGNSEKYMEYVKLDDSHIFCGQNGYSAENFVYYGSYVTTEGNTSNGSFTIIKASRRNDVLLVKLSDGVTENDILNALNELNEVYVGNYSNYTFTRAGEGWQSECDYLFTAPQIPPKEAKKTYRLSQKPESHNGEPTELRLFQ